MEDKKLSEMRINDWPLVYTASAREYKLSMALCGRLSVYMRGAAAAFKKYIFYILRVINDENLAIKFESGFEEFL